MPRFASTLAASKCWSLPSCSRSYFDPISTDQDTVPRHKTVQTVQFVRFIRRIPMVSRLVFRVHALSWHQLLSPAKWMGHEEEEN